MHNPTRPQWNIGYSGKLRRPPAPQVLRRGNNHHPAQGWEIRSRTHAPEPWFDLTDTSPDVFPRYYTCPLQKVQQFARSLSEATLLAGIDLIGRLQQTTGGTCRAWLLRLETYYIKPYRPWWSAAWFPQTHQRIFFSKHRHQGKRPPHEADWACDRIDRITCFRMSCSRVTLAGGEFPSEESVITHSCGRNYASIVLSSSTPRKRVCLRSYYSPVLYTGRISNLTARTGTWNFTVHVHRYLRNTDTGYRPGAAPPSERNSRSCWLECIYNDGRTLARYHWGIILRIFQRPVRQGPCPGDYGCFGVDTEVRPSTPECRWVAGLQGCVITHKSPAPNRGEGASNEAMYLHQQTV